MFYLLHVARIISDVKPADIPIRFCYDDYVVDSYLLGDGATAFWQYEVFTK